MKHIILSITIYILLLISFSCFAASELTIDLVDQRITVLRDAGVSDEDEVMKTYQAAREFLKAAALFDSKNKQNLEELKNESGLQKESLRRARDEITIKRELEYDIDILSKDELEAQFTIVNAQLDDARNDLGAVDKHLSARETEAQSTRQRIGEIADRLNQLSSEQTAIKIDASPSLFEASQWVLKAERISLIAERKAQQSSLATQPARYSLLQVQRAELEIRVNRLTEEVQALKTKHNEAELSEVETIIGISEYSSIYMLAQEIIDERAELRKERVELLKSSSEFDLKKEKLKKYIETISDRLAAANRVVKFAGESEALGRILLAHWQDIETYNIKESLKDITNINANIIISRIEHEEELSKLYGLRLYVQSLLERKKIDYLSLSDDEVNAFVNIVRTKRDELREVIDDESDYIELLSSYSQNYLQYKALLEEYKNFIGSRILWIPSSSNIFKVDITKIPNEIRQVLLQLSTVRFNLFSLNGLLGIIFAIVIFYLRAWLSEKVSYLNKKIGRPRNDSIVYTFGALVITMLQTLPIPLVVWSIGKIFQTDNSLAAVQMAALFQGSSILLFIALFVRNICNKEGLGQRHFDWGNSKCERAQKEAVWVVKWFIPLLFVTVMTLEMQDLTPGTGLSQFFSLMTISLIGLHLISSIRSETDKWLGLDRFLKEHYLESFLIAIIATTFIALILGYVYTVRVLVGFTIYSTGVLVIALTSYSILHRWVVITQRRIRLNELIAKRDISNKDEYEDDEGPELADISEDTSELMKVSMITLTALVLIYIWSPYLTALGALGRVTLWTSSEVVNNETITTSVTLLSVFISIFVLVATFYAAGKLPALIALILRRRVGVSASAGYTISTLLNYFIFGAGLIFVLSNIGLQWSKLQWLVAALGVGIGFGLQEIVANFISGLIILFERPIRLGDVVTLGTQDGTVTKIRIRATTLKDWDGKELLVPNKEFITQRLLNWTLSDSTTRLIITVGVAYGSDVRKAIKLLEEVVKKHPKVLETPSASIIFNLFGDNALNLVARFFISNVEDRMKILTDLHQDIYDAFNEAGIVIAFPQRDVHIDSVQPITVKIDNSDI